MNTQASNHATKKDRRPSSVVIVLLGLSFFLFVEVVFLLLRQVSSTSDLQRANELLAEQSKYLMMHSKSKHFDIDTTANDEVNTAVVISSSWIPSHPSTSMIDQVISSMDSFVIGLSPSAPIIITIDTLNTNTTNDNDNNPISISNKLNALEDYSMNLTQKYFSDSRIHIIPGMKHLHIGGSVLKAMEIIEVQYPNIEFMYYIQHDFPFTKYVDHTALVNAMRTREELNSVRFCYRNQPYTKRCGNATHILLNHTDQNLDWGDGKAPQLWATGRYSDNNHFARFNWNKNLIASLGDLQRSPEEEFIEHARALCLRNQSLGLYQYPGNVLTHLDGREAGCCP